MAGVRLPADWSVSLTYSVNEDTTKEEVYQQYFEILADYMDKDIFIDQEGNTATALEIGQYFAYETEKLQSEESETYTLGTRCDFHNSAALKMEYLIQDINTYTSAGEIVRNPKAYRISMDVVF